jgi:hypothetical protein
MAELLHISIRDLDFLKSSDIIKGFNELCENLLLRPLISSKMRGSWDRSECRKIEKKESKQEVGWLYRNISEHDRCRLSLLNSGHLTHEFYNSRWYLEHVNEERLKRGLARISRMRSDYRPISIAKGI